MEQSLLLTGKDHVRGRGEAWGVGVTVRASGLRWRLMFCLIAPLTFVMSLDRTAMVVAAPTIQHEFGFSLVQMSWILTSFSWTYALLQVPSGWLAERFGPRRMLYWANFLWSVLTAATPLAGSFTGFIVVRGLLGAGQSADWPSSIVAIRRWFPHSERAKGNSILLGGLYLGPIAAAPVTTWVILRFGWAWAFYGFGLVGLLIGATWWFWFRDNPPDHPAITAQEVAHIAAGQHDAAASIPRGVFIRCLPDPRFWAIGMQYFFLVLIQSF